MKCTENPATFPCFHVEIYRLLFPHRTHRLDVMLNKIVAVGISEG